MTNSSDVYELLKFETPDLTKLIRRNTDVELSSGRVAHAIDSSGRRALVVPLDLEDREVTDNESRGISFETFTSSEAQDLSRVLIVRCLEERLNAQFGLLVDDTLRALRVRPENPGAVCLEVLHRWRSLFADRDNGLLSQSQQIGLISELHVLEALVRADMPTALRAWRGPDRSRHDFLGMHSAVEVKATTSRDQLLISIHGAMQLEAPPRTSLFLYVEQLELSPRGESLPQLVNRILGLGVNAADLLSSLREAGYHQDDASSYAGFRYVVLRRKLCAIDEDFPRIVKSSFIRHDVLDRIARVEYVVNIGPVTSAVPDEAALSGVVERITGGARPF